MVPLITSLFPPGFFNPEEPIYVIPPDELEADIEYSANKFRELAESRDWGHTNLGLKALHDRGIVGEGVLIAICDTGMDTRHPDLSPNVIETGHRDFTGSPSGFFDRQGHGTHCAGISASSANGSGLIGAAPRARLLAAKVLSDQGSGASSWIAAGIRHAADTGADIISLSLGGPSPDTRTLDAVTYAAGKGCWIVCAAGNDGRPATSYPGHYPVSIAVAATDRSNLRASFSTINPQNDVSAPGVGIMSTLPDNRYGQMSGTSMATPYVAGCLALVRGELKRQKRAIPPQSEILRALRVWSRDLPPTGVDERTGAGLIDPTRLIAELVGGSPPSPPTPPPTPPTPPTPPPTPPMTFTTNLSLTIDPVSRRVVAIQVPPVP